jgi:hypothetical protein
LATEVAAAVEDLAVAARHTDQIDEGLDTQMYFEMDSAEEVRRMTDVDPVEVADRKHLEEHLYYFVQDFPLVVVLVVKSWVHLILDCKLMRMGLLEGVLGC